ncbi:ead/Ea22-like family protein [Salmonella enterica subsp. enterica]|nr:ead/Ea22-like family protein [Salmonella enterica subsp. enterica]
MRYISQFEASDIDSDDIDLRFEVDGTETGTTVSIVDECGHAAQIITALLDELDKKQQYIKLRDQENEDIALTVGKLRVELEHYKSREERVTKLVLDNSTSWDALYEKLEAAERRIAELEAKLSKPVLLPKTNGYWNEQEKAYEEAITLARRQIRLAGFRCEGDE